MGRFLIIAIICSLTVGCKQKKMEKPPAERWQLEKVVDLKGVRPIGLVKVDDGFYLSDGDHNQVIFTDHDFVATGKKIQGLQRPMHLDTRVVDGSVQLLVPEYGRDSIASIVNGKMRYLTIPDSLDAPAAVSAQKDELAIADFYNNRILYYDGTDWKSYGTPGKHEGELNYPTDVQLAGEEIYIADAYNHRVQVFDKTGEFVRMIGQQEKMNASTGLHVSGKLLAVTDFENDRVILYDTAGGLIQILEEGIKKPTDVLLDGNLLYITNYQAGEIVIYRKME